MPRAISSLLAAGEKYGVIAVADEAELVVK
jgi:hypothetical protein